VYPKQEPSPHYSIGLDVSFTKEMKRPSEAKSDLKFLRINAIKFDGVIH